MVNSLHFNSTFPVLMTFIWRWHTGLPSLESDPQPCRGKAGALPTDTQPSPPAGPIDSGERLGPV